MSDRTELINKYNRVLNDYRACLRVTAYASSVVDHLKSNSPWEEQNLARKQLKEAREQEYNALRLLNCLGDALDNDAV